MDIGEVLQLGDLMEVEIEGSYASTKVANIEDGLITVDYLTSRGRPVHLREEELYVLLKKSSAGMYFFNARYVGRFKDEEENRYYMQFRVVSEPIKNQRRQSYRIPLRLRLRMLVVHPFVMSTTLAATQKGPRKSDLNKEWTETYAKDISEDGMLIATPVPPEIDSHIMLMFRLDENELFTNAVVRRHTYEKNTDTRPNMIGVQFVELPENTKRMIRKFVMDYQIQERIQAGDVYFRY